VISSVAGTASGPVPGLPHSQPLGGQIVMGSRTADGTTDLYPIDTGTGQVLKRVTAGASGAQSPILSPDRGSIVYVQASSIAGTLRTSAADGTGDRALFEGRPNDCQTYFRPAWNPIDQTELALVCVTTSGSYVLSLISTAGGVRSVIDTGFAVVNDVAYSRDGATLTYWAADSAGTGGGSIYTQPAEGGQPPTKISDPGDATDSNPMFSPDATRIVFRRTPAGDTGSQLVLVDADGSNLQPLTNGSATDQDPVWSPDGTQIAFRSNRTGIDGSSKSRFWVMAADGTGITELGAGSAGVAAGPPAWGHR